MDREEKQKGIEERKNKGRKQKGIEGGSFLFGKEAVRNKNRTETGNNRVKNWGTNQNRINGELRMEWGGGTRKELKK